MSIDEGPHLVGGMGADSERTRAGDNEGRVPGATSANAPERDPKAEAKLARKEAKKRRLEEAVAMTLAGACNGDVDLLRTQMAHANAGEGGGNQS